MTDLLLQIGFSNVCVSLVLAIGAYAVHKTARLPFIAHVLWVLVLVKLVTPPLLTIPVVTVPGLATSPQERATGLSGLDVASGEVLVRDANGLRGAFEPGAGAIGIDSVNSLLVEYGPTALIVLWVLGSVCVFTWSLVRIVRFHRLLGMACDDAPPALQEAASEIGRRLGLGSTPRICTTSARISPMVWWIGGRVRVLIPDALIVELDDRELRWIMAHELAHVRRHDHVVRWLEWLACVGFWWDPIAWWARRNLRINEEICCDAMVLSSLRPRPQSYANALMTVVEFLAAPVIRPPAVASEITSGGLLERRFTMIVSMDRFIKTPRWLSTGIVIVSLGVVPLGVAYGQDYDAVGERLGEAVRNGELSREQAGVMLDALRKSAPPAESKRITRESYARTEAEFKKAVEAGRISGEDARKRLGEMREMMAKQGERAERRVTREEYARAEAELKKAVKAGRISGEDARKRLGAMREMMAKQGERGERRITREEYARAETEFKKMVADGKIKAEDAKTRLAEMRRMIGEGGERNERHITREDYAKAEAELRKAVEAGRISGEDARKRLGVMREMIAGQGERGERRITREDYARAEAEFKKMVADGKIKAEDAKTRLGEMRRMIGERNREPVTDNTRRERDVDLDGLRRQIEGAVERGDMTREQANAVYRGIRERMGGRRERDRDADRDR